MFNLFKKKKPMVVVATLNARLQPDDRADIEDALDAAMAKHKHGVRVVGGGTLIAKDGEVRECDIEIELDDPSDAKIDMVMRTLEAMLAPKGSRLNIPDQSRRIDFGLQEGLALYLNGTDLPDEVYRDSDVNHVFAECQRLLQGIGAVSSHWQGPEETAFYMYGSDFKIMRERLAPFLNTYPLCQQCRVEQIA
jgi:hypothetical protein